MKLLPLVVTLSTCWSCWTSTTLAAPIPILSDGVVLTNSTRESWPSMDYKKTEFTTLVSRIPQPEPICRKDCL